MYCTNCGKEIRKEWKFCKYCSADLSQNAEAERYKEDHPEAEALELTAGDKRTETADVVCEQFDDALVSEKETWNGAPQKKSFSMSTILIVLCVIMFVTVAVLFVRIERAISAISIDGPVVVTEATVSEDRIYLDVVTEATVSEDRIYLDVVDEDEAIPLADNPLYEKLAEVMGIDFMSEQIDHYSSDEEHVSVYLSNCSLITSDYVVELGDGSRFQFPMTYKDLCDAGWQLKNESDKENLGDYLGAEMGDWYGFINADGKTLNADLWNYEEKPVALNDARVLALQMGNIWTEDFSIKGISREATVEEIVAEFGLPFGSSYYRWKNGGESLHFYYINDTNYTDLSFSLDPATGLLDSVSYYVTNPEWWGE